MSGKYVLKKASNGQFYFNLKAGNGEIILTSEMYSAKSSAQTGIASVQSNCTDDSKYTKLSSSGGYYFTLKAANGQIIGTSEMYVSSSGRDNGIQSVKTNGTTKVIDDQT